MSDDKYSLIQLPRTRNPFARMPPLYNTIGATRGASVLGIRYDKGAMIAADTLVSYGSENSFPDEARVFKVNENIVIGSSGDHADFQMVHNLIDIKIIDDFCHGEPDVLRPNMLACWLSNMLYDRHKARIPLFCEIVMGGIKHDGSPFLAAVDRSGGYFEDFVVATGPAAMGLPMVSGQKPRHREYTYREAAKLIENVMTVLFYRNCAAIKNYLVAICGSDNCGVFGPFKITEHWKVAEIVEGY